MPRSYQPRHLANVTLPAAFTLCCLIIASLFFSYPVHCATDRFIRELRKDTFDLFYHGFDNYMQHAFPEDELKPLSCRPLTRDRDNPAHVEVNDVLGNYSLTLIDSLSTLAILASTVELDQYQRDPLRDFQDGIKSLVSLYGDGSTGAAGRGLRSRGFDLDSKVQVFETVIRGVGGLLSAHLFAIGELPIRGYEAHSSTVPGQAHHISWPNNFVYNGQLLRLARDLADRLLPAFFTATGLPYPRVNLRTGVPFYPNSPLNFKDDEQCHNDDDELQEITETCSAGAGSLVLEFSLLTRLTGDVRYEQLARRAFYAVWDRRSAIGLIGAGIDAETGQWVGPYAGIGAGIDSFFEYAVKTHIMLSGLPELEQLNQSKTSPEFLDVWDEAHLGIKRHLYRGAAFQHPHYIQGDVYTGATRAFWIDSLSAYYPGLLTLSGDVDEAIEIHMLFTALWTRYSALPERWNTASGSIDMGLRWWPGRPEFIESTWYLYRATQDPWYLHVGEMVLRDIERRCWTECGWAGLEDVRTGELKDRMESFFLGETAKYMMLLFDPMHPLNQWDAPFVFTTEGHPLIIPRSAKELPQGTRIQQRRPKTKVEPQCPLPPVRPPLTMSNIAARHDFFHAASLARLHSSTAESSMSDPKIAQFDRHSRNNFTFYPWTLPTDHIPGDGMSSLIESRVTFDLSFPTFPNAVSGSLTFRRIANGVSLSSVSGMKFSMIRERIESPPGEAEDVFRISGVSHLSLGRDEILTISREVAGDLNPSDPYFTRHRDISVLDLVIDTPISPNHLPKEETVLESTTGLHQNLTSPHDGENSGGVNNFLQQLSSIFKDNISLLQSASTLLSGQAMNIGAAQPFHMLEAATATGPGAGPLPDVADAILFGSDLTDPNLLPWHSIYLSDETCSEILPSHVPREYQRSASHQTIA
ncbi:hypothetical protein FH972_024686 [Carpinus fangiana]|uniref:alpha-1,2-Mannosidase n=1 Tax=Carpinus fangiana TaxID=176857 RepID=A0A5N6L189_9ROSI|nr:hypothetical protein FH972_024686 [Carpinus fangiana]